MKHAFPVLTLALLLAGCASLPKPSYSGQHFDLKALDKGVYAAIHRFGGAAICNVGIVNTGDATIVFDAFLSPDAAAELIAAVRKRGLPPIRYVVNSHAHNDHVRGNQVFGPEVRIISTRQTAETIRQEEPRAIEAEKGYAKGQFEFFDRNMREYTGDTTARAYLTMKMMRPYFEELSKSHEKIKTRLPDTFVDKEMTLSGPKNTVILRDMGSCHSGSDLVMYLPKRKILFAGDIAFNEFHPYLGDGNVDDWRTALRQLQKLDIRLVTPGHGEVGGKAMLARLITYMDDLEAIAAGLAKNDRPLTEAETRRIPTPYAAWWLENFYADNLKWMYAKALKAPSGK
ncbi:MAG: MBL fold metallo-hydrolase [Saprospiraceae bacterium]